MKIPKEDKTPSVMKHWLMDLRSNAFFLMLTASENSWKSTLLVFPWFGLTARLCSAEVSCSCRSIPGCFPEKEPSVSPDFRLTVRVGCHVVIFDCWMRKRFLCYRFNAWDLLASRLDTTLSVVVLCNVLGLEHRNSPHSHFTHVQLVSLILHLFLQFLSLINDIPFLYFILTTCCTASLLPFLLNFTIISTDTFKINRTSGGAHCPKL